MKYQDKINTVLSHQIKADINDANSFLESANVVKRYAPGAARNGLDRFFDGVTIILFQAIKTVFWLTLEIALKVLPPLMALFLYFEILPILLAD